MSYFKRLTNDKEILKLISQSDIFKYYIPNFETLGRLFRSNLRNENNPSCRIKERGGILRYRDFTESEEYNCFAYVAKLYGVNYYQALEIIRKDFNLPLMPETTLSWYKASERIPTITGKDEFSDAEKAPLEMKVKIRDWSKIDKQYWFDKYQITIKDLTKFQVYPISFYWINNSLRPCVPKAYAYYFGKYEDGREMWKVYQPFLDKKNKWRTNCNELVFQGFNQLPWIGDVLIITKSLKDVIVLDKIGYPAIAPHGEGYKLEEESICKFLKRFRRLVILYDNDKVGINRANTLSKEFNLETIFLPEGSKDPSDFVENHSYDSLKEYLQSKGI